MRTALIVAGLVVLSGSAMADEKCRAELDAAFAKQSAVPKMRTLIVNPITGATEGTVTRTIDLVRPDKVHSSTQSSAEEGIAEAVVMGRWAWSNNGMGWEEVKPNIAHTMAEDVAKMAQVQAVSANFNCLGKVAFEGKDYLGYRSDPGKAPDGAELVTTVYVDGTSGLPVYNVITPATGNGPFRFKATYTYTDDIVVEAPIEPTQTMTVDPAPAAAQPQKN